jgi:hypothetical protein
MRQALEGCVIEDFDSNTEWDLSWGCLTGVKAREALRNMKHNDPLFWAELTQSGPQDLPDSAKTLPEDCEPDTNLEDKNLDDSNLPLQLLIDTMTGSDLPNDVSQQQDSILISLADAENIDLDPETASKSSERNSETGQLEGRGLGVGKRWKIASRRYNSKMFWWHNNGDDWRDDNLLP